MNKKERLVLPGLLKTATTEIEGFQNASIRPIIKMQHDLLIGCFKNYVIKRKIDFLEMSDSKKSDQISSMYTKDMVFKNFTIGLIVSHFSLSELNFYNDNSSELNKRTIKIIQKRISDSL